MAFLAELKRRRVGKVAIGYGAVAWAVTESASVVLPALRVPEWAMTTIVDFSAGRLSGRDGAGMGLRRHAPGHPAHRAPARGIAERAKRLRVRAAYGAMVLVAMAGLGYLLYERGLGRAQAGEPHSSIAVLPFTNLSGDASKDYFSDGMSEELLNLLARVPGLQGRVAHLGVRIQGPQRRHPRGRYGARCRNRTRGQRAPGRRPGADYRAADRHRDRLSPLVRNLRSQARGHLRGAGRNRAGDRRQAAHPARARGAATRAARKGPDAGRRSVRALPAGTRDLETARRGKPAPCHRVVPGGPRQGSRVRPRQRRAWPRCTSCCPATPRKRTTKRNTSRSPKQSARQALSLDPKIGEAHAVLAQINAERGNLLDAESGFFFAISLEPNEPTPHHWYSILLQKVGRLDAALTQARRAYELDPSSPIIAANLASAYLMARRGRTGRCAMPNWPRSWA